MLNTLSAQIFDPLGYIELDVTPETINSETRRRVNSIATLDGGTVVNDAGFSHGDRVFDLAWKNTSPAVSDAVDRMLQLYERVTLSSRAGVFDVALETYKPRPDESRLRLLVVSKLSV